MKNIKVFTLTLIAIVGIIYIGANGLMQNYSWGPFLVFIGACSVVGFTMDVFNHFRTKGTR